MDSAQVRNRPKMEFVEIHFLKSIFEKSSADQQGRRYPLDGVTYFMLPITLHQLTLFLSLIAKYCKKLVNLNLASFEEKLTPKKLNHRHKLFLDFISFKRYFPK